MAGGALAWFWYFSPALSGNEVYFNAENKASIETGWEEALRKVSETSTGSADLNDETGTNKPPNLTEAFSGALARTLGPRILEEGGLQNVPISDLEAAAAYLPTADAILPPTPAISETEFKISEKNDTLSVKKYFESVFAVYKKTFFELKEDDLTILRRVFLSENYGDLSGLDAITAAFDKSIEDIKKIAVPRGREGFATRELGYLIRSGQIVEKFKNAKIDPMTTIILIPKRVEIIEEVNKFHKETGDALKQSGIIFKEGEGAYELFY